jgi:hypothetical protein
MEGCTLQINNIHKYHIYINIVGYTFSYATLVSCADFHILIQNIAQRKTASFSSCSPCMQNPSGLHACRLTEFYDYAIRQ